jgi:ATP-dependent helicase/nuclease subunit A
VRTLYVALTRAKERLILLAAKPSRGRAPWVEALSAWGYSPKEPPGDNETIHKGHVLHREASRVAHPRRAAPPAEGEPEAVAAYEKAIRAVEERARPPFRRPSGIREEKAARLDAAEDDSAAAAPARDVALAAGTAVHAALERWDPRSGTPAAAGLRDLALRAAAEHGADPDAVEGEAREALDAFAASPLAARLRSVEVLGREVPVLLREPDGTTVAGFLDLLYRDTDGTVVVADYKTDRALAADEAEKRYGAQLGAYAETVRRAMRLPSPPRTELWLVRRGEILLVQAGSE